jgi:hypothetical protein
VREWCRDVKSAYKATPKPVDDPQFPLDSSPSEGAKVEMVVRGASWNLFMEDRYTIRRDAVDPDEGKTDLGFRIVLECPEGPPDRP